MVQLIPAAQRKPSFSEKLSGAISTGLNMGSEALRNQREKEGRILAAEKMGMDPAIFNLPEQAQAEFFKNQFQRQKPLNELQEAQKRLAEQRSRNLESTQGFFNRLTGDSNQDIGEEQQSNLPSSNIQNPFSRMSEDQLNSISSFEGQPGEMGVAGTMAANELKRREKSPEKQRQNVITSEQAKQDVKYNSQLQEASKQHALKEKTLENLEQLNKKGVTGKPWEKAAEKFGLVNLTSEGRREFAAEVKNLITDIRSILGGQFSNFEFQTILNAYPSADFNQKANAAIMKNLKYFQDIKSKEVVFAEQLKKENGGKIPEDFQSKVNEKVRGYAESKIPEIKENTYNIMKAEYGVPDENYLLLDPNGEPLNIPSDQVAMYLERGASFP